MKNCIDTNKGPMSEYVFDIFRCLIEVRFFFGDRELTKKKSNLKLLNKLCTFSPRIFRCRVCFVYLLSNIYNLFFF